MGTTFKIYFPRVHRASETKPADTGDRIADAELCGSETLLLVEDDSAQCATRLLSFSRSVAIR